ncbi:MAG: M13 family metallopeptidase [Parvularculaceae bacterium]
MKKVILGATAALALQACNQQASDKTTDPAAHEQSAAPEIGDFGIDLQSIDASVTPGDDFYEYANGAWLKSFKIPDEYSSYGSFTVLAERTENQLHSIIETVSAGRAAPGAAAQQIGDFYASYMDVERINALGLEPLAADFARIDALSTKADIAAAFADPDLGAATPIGVYISVDAKSPDRYAVYLTQAGLGLPNRDYYLQDKFADKQERYRAYIEDTLTLAGFGDAGQRAAAIYALENAIAEAHWEPAKRRNRDLTYNPKTLDQLAAFTPDFPWAAYFEAAGLSGRTWFVVREDDAVRRLAGIVAATPTDVWKDYLKFHLLRTHADILPAQFDELNFAFYGTQLRGALKQRERWKRAIDAVDDGLGEAVGKLYVEEYFPPQSKEMMEALVDNLKEALKERIEVLPWMTEETKTQALAKLENFTPKIGYPDIWRDYAGLSVVRGDAYGNAKRAARFDWDYDVARLDAPVDKTEWGMTPQTVNAYYSPTRNEIVFPAAILQAPFFDPHADAAVNYGGIGAVIGHEIGHGFDDQGRKSDGEGKLRDWWTSEDADAFQTLADEIGAQYSSYEPLPGFAVNPELTMGENIGDIGGLAMAYHAYKIALGGEEAPVLDGFTGDQRFFLSWAQVWKRVVRDEALKNQIASDPHAPAKFRVNGVVRNMDPWYNAFGVEEDQALYLPPDARVEIW